MSWGGLSSSVPFSLWWLFEDFGSASTVSGLIGMAGLITSEGTDDVRQLDSVVTKDGLD